MPDFKVNYSPKNKAARNRGCIDISYTITDSPNPTAARRSADESMTMEGFDLLDYKRGKPREVAGTPTAAAQTDDDQSALTSQPAGVESSVAEAEPGHHEQLDKLYQDDPAPSASVETIDDQVAELNQQIAALGVGERLRLENIPATVYHQSMGYGSSAVKTVIENCPGLLRAELDGVIERDEDKYVQGSASHDRLLLPEVFERDYVIRPKEIKVRSGKAWEQFKADNPDVTIITQDQHDAAQAMRTEFLWAFQRYFIGGTAEVSYWYRDPDTGLILKARPDYEKGKLGCDVKTIGLWPSPANVDRQFRNLLYYVQESHYLRVTGLQRYPFFFVSTKKPHPTLGPRDSSDELAALGALECQQAYRTIKYCEDNDDWPWWQHAYEQVEPGYNERKKLEQYREGITA